MIRIPLAAVASMFIVFAAPPASTAGQELAQSRLQGMRVRATSASLPPVVGTVESQTAGQLEIRVAGGRVESVMVDSITKLERSLGQRSSAGKGAISGAVAGGLAGVGFGVWVGSAICGSCDVDGSDYLLLGALYGSIGALGGTLVGAIIGSAIHNERWGEIPAGPDRTAPVQVRMTPAPEGGMTVGLSIGIR